MARAKLVPDERGAGRFLPWVLALMVFLASLAAVGALALDNAIRRWDAGVRGTITVEIPWAASPPLETQVEAALAVVRSTAGVSEARLLERDELARLLAPWLGADAPLDDLPLPALIDVSLSPTQPPDIELLRRRLAEAVPAAILDDHQAWLGRLLRLARGVQAAAAGVVALLAAAMAAVVVLAMRATLAANHDVLEVLHLIGARDGYVARQFQAHAVRLSLRGAVAGLALTVLLGAMLLYLWLGVDGAVAAIAEAPWLAPAAALIAVPAVSIGIATLAARWAVMRELARML
jgi:cell division transport system permease protein